MFHPNDLGGQRSDECLSLGMVLFGYYSYAGSEKTPVIPRLVIEKTGSHYLTDTAKTVHSSSSKCEPRRYGQTRQNLIMLCSSETNF